MATEASCHRLNSLILATTLQPFNELDPYSSSRDTLSDKDRDRDHTIQGGGHVITLSSHAMMTGGGACRWWFVPQVRLAAAAGICGR